MGRRQTVPADSVAVKMLTTGRARRHHCYQHLGLAISCGACFTILYVLHYISVVRSDSPYSLITATLEAIPPLAGTETTGFGFTLFTGDLLAHDPNIQQSRCVEQ